MVHYTIIYYYNLLYCYTFLSFWVDINSSRSISETGARYLEPPGLQELQNRSLEREREGALHQNNANVVYNYNN